MRNYRTQLGAVFQLVQRCVRRGLAWAGKIQIPGSYEHAGWIRSRTGVPMAIDLRQSTEPEPKYCA